MPVPDLDPFAPAFITKRNRGPFHIAETPEAGATYCGLDVAELISLTSVRHAERRGLEPCRNCAKATA